MECVSHTPRFPDRTDGQVWQRGFLWCVLICGVSQDSRTAEAGRHLLIIWCTAPAQPGTARVGCPGLCPVRLGISPQMETPPPLCETSAWTPSQCKTASRCSEETSCVPVCAFYPLCCHWTQLKIESLALSSSSSPFRLFLYITKSFPELSLLQAEQSQLSWPLLTGNKLQCLSLPRAAQDAAGCLCCKGTLLAHGQLLVHQDLKLPLSQAAFCLLSSRLINKICKVHLKMNSRLKCVSA